MPCPWKWWNLRIERRFSDSQSQLCDYVDQSLNHSLPWCPTYLWPSSFFIPARIIYKTNIFIGIVRPFSSFDFPRKILTCLHDPLKSFITYCCQHPPSLNDTVARFHHCSATSSYFSNPILVFEVCPFLFDYNWVQTFSFLLWIQVIFVMTGSNIVVKTWFESSIRILLLLLGQLLWFGAAKERMRALFWVLQMLCISYDSGFKTIHLPKLSEVYLNKAYLKLFSDNFGV